MLVEARIFFLIFFFIGGDEKEGRGGPERQRKEGEGGKWVGGRT